MGKQKVGFVGPYSSANFGDWAMLVNNIYDINCFDVVIFTYNQKFPKNSVDEYCSERNLKYVEVELKDQLQQEISYITPFDVLKQLDNSTEVFQAIDEIDILIVSGGGWLNHFWTERKEKLYKMMIPIYVASQKQKKIVFTANGIGPFDETKEFYRYFFGHIRNTKIAIRDNLYSKSHLLEVGISGDNVHYIPDDLYIINQNLLEKEIKQEIKQKEYIVMEMFFPLEKLKQYEQRLISFSKKIYQKYGLSIVLLPYDLVHYGSDQAKYLQSIFEKSVLYNIDNLGFLPIQDAYSITKNAKMMITSRYHGLVLSLSAETPVIFRLYETRNDIRYSYNKGLGILRAAFDGMEFCETDFLQRDLLGILVSIEESMELIISRQNKLYSNPRYRENKEHLKKLRSNYIKNILE